MDVNEISNSQGNEFLIEALRCNICLNISLTPVVCSICEYVFCKECIDEWKSKKNICPIRCSKLEIRSAPRVIKNILSKLLYICKKCNNEIPLEESSSHSNLCEEDLKACLNCNLLIKVRFLETHIKLFCLNVKVSCLNCNSDVSRSQLIIDTCSQSQSQLNKSDSALIKLNNRIKELEKEINTKDEIIFNLRNCNKTSILLPESLEFLRFRQLWDISNLKQIDIKKELGISNNSFKIEQMRSFKWSDTNYILLVISGGCTLTFDLRGNKVIRKLVLSSDNFSCIAENSSGFFFASFDGGITFVSHSSLINQQSVLSKKKLDCPVTCIKITHEFLSTTSFILGDVQGYLKLLIYNSSFETVFEKKIHSSRIQSVEYLENKNWVLTFSKDKTAKIFDLLTCEILRTFNLEFPFFSSCQSNNKIFFNDSQGNIYTFNQFDKGEIINKYKSNTNEANKLQAYKLSEFADVLIGFHYLTGISFYYSKLDEISFCFDKSICDVISFDIIQTEDTLIEDKQNSILVNNISSNNLVSNLQGSDNNIQFNKNPQCEKVYGLISLKGGMFSIVKLDKL